jgi:hypothetical protein
VPEVTEVTEEIEQDEDEFETNVGVKELASAEGKMSVTEERQKIE